ncbi:MAG: ChbG/HpnK family deacetylase [Selenomonadaceae bacterium]|nr:ChbG/HpnK family deacetylase [Selenomonadaceae bacterium]
MKNLIVNADDFGRHELINRAVERAFNAGCLKSATLMAGGIAFDDAVKLAKKNSGLGVGIHFTLANGNPVLNPKKIPSLVTEEGIFHDNYVKFLKRYLSGKISLSEVRSELAAQLEKILNTGLTLTHFDSHQHLHHVPGVIEITLDLAKAAGIKSMRVASTKIFDGELDSLGKLFGRLGLGSLAKFAAHKAHKKNFATPEHFAGIVAGESVSENFMLNLIENLQDGTTEVMLHPGTDNKILCDFCQWEHDFEEELAAVTSPRVLNLLAEKNISAINFADLRLIK